MTKLKSECPNCKYTTSSNKTIVDGAIKRNRTFNVQCYNCKKNYIIKLVNNEYKTVKRKIHMATEFIPIKTLKQIKREYETINDKLKNLQTRIDNLHSILSHEYTELIPDIHGEGLEFPILEVEIEKIDNLIHFLD